MSLPNFLIVGAAKSGTTSLYHYLRQHPDIFMPKLKEPAYFAAEVKGVHDFRDYQALFLEGGEKKARGEASVAYLFDQDAPDKIKKALGNPKIIIVLRNPVEMAYSLFWHQVRECRETLSFQESLAVEDWRFGDSRFRQQCIGWYADYLYTRRAKYFHQVKRHFEVFGEDQIHIELYQDFVADPLSICQRIFSILDVPTDFTPDTKAIHNAAGKTISKSLYRVVNQTFPGKNIVKAVVPLNLRQAAKKKLNQLNRKTDLYTPIDEITREKLKQIFRPDVVQLAKLLRRDLSSWM